MYYILFFFTASLGNTVLRHGPVKHVRIRSDATCIKAMRRPTLGDEEQNKIPLGYWRYTLPREVTEYDWRKNGGC